MSCHFLGFQHDHSRAWPLPVRAMVHGMRRGGRVLKRPESGWARTRFERNLEATAGFAFLCGVVIFGAFAYQAGAVLLSL